MLQNGTSANGSALKTMTAWAFVHQIPHLKSLMIMKFLPCDTLIVTLDHHPGGDSPIDSAVEFIDKKSVFGIY